MSTAARTGGGRERDDVERQLARAADRGGRDRPARRARAGRSLSRPSLLRLLAAAVTARADGRGPGAAPQRAHRTARRRRRGSRTSAPPRCSSDWAIPTLRYSKEDAPAGRRAGGELFSGVNVPSKAFGEFVEHHYDTPRVPPQEIKRADRQRQEAGDPRFAAVRGISPHEHPRRHRRAGRRTGLSGARPRARSRHAGGGQLRRPHAQHHRLPVPAATRASRIRWWR